MADYYPKFYYSFAVESKLSTFLKKRRSRYFCSGKKTLDGVILKFLFGDPYYYCWLSRISLKDTTSILDIGCGNGTLVKQLSAGNFTRILGIDLFIENDFRVSNNCEIQKKTVFDVEEKFDLIMMHDSLEHMNEQENVLLKIASLMHSNATLVVRIPILGEAFLKYGIFWGNLDAPRHFYLHSRKSMQILAQKSGLKITQMLFDSNESQFILSEQYKLGISQLDDRSYVKSQHNSGYSKAQVIKFKRQADNWNKQEIGDHAAFFLQLI